MDAGLVASVSELQSLADAGELRHAVHVFGWPKPPEPVWVTVRAGAFTGRAEHPDRAAVHEGQPGQIDDDEARVAVLDSGAQRRSARACE
jgi:hypothetical protein